VGYPGTEAHRSKHRELISEVERLTTLFHQANDLKTIDLLVVMFDWIIDHIKQADQEFKPFV
jgi:hemerythrin